MKLRTTSISTTRGTFPMRPRRGEASNFKSQIPEKRQSTKVFAPEGARPRAMPLGFGVDFFGLKLHSRAGLWRILSAIFSQQGGSHLIKQLLDATPVLQGAVEDPNHGPGNIE